MMSAVILEEIKTVAVALVSGALITFVYDLIRIFRRVLSHGNVWIGIEDFFFWIWTSLWIFSVLYRENDGNLRMYTILVMVIGMILYHKLWSAPFVRISAAVLKKMVKIAFFPLKKAEIYIIFFGNKLKKFLKRIIIKDNR